MKLETEILTAAEVRRSLTNEGDIRGEVAYQNDVNALLARVEQWQMPWRSLSDLSPPAMGPAIVADTTPLPVARPSIPRLSPLVVAPRAPARSARRA